MIYEINVYRHKTDDAIIKVKQKLTPKDMAFTFNLPVVTIDTESEKFRAQYEEFIENP